MVSPLKKRRSESERERLSVFDRYETENEVKKRRKEGRETS